MYTVKLFDAAGQFSTDEIPGFDAVLSRVQALAFLFPEKIIRVFNAELCDVDTDGLTEDESDAVDALVVNIKAVQ